jgi:hypothetical protein
MFVPVTKIVGGPPETFHGCKFVPAKPSIARVDPELTLLAKNKVSSPGIGKGAKAVSTTCCAAAPDTWDPTPIGIPTGSPPLDL